MPTTGEPRPDRRVLKGDTLTGERRDYAAVEQELRDVCTQLSPAYLRFNDAFGKVQSLEWFMFGGPLSRLEGDDQDKFERARQIHAEHVQLYKEAYEDLRPLEERRDRLFEELRQLGY